jgi:hypothetical protein
MPEHMKGAKRRRRPVSELNEAQRYVLCEELARLLDRLGITPSNYDLNNWTEDIAEAIEGAGE